MTISTTTNRVTYTGNGVTVAFSFPYAFFAKADLVVIETVIATGVQTTKALTTDYTIAGSVDALGHYSSGGTVTAVTAPASTVTWTIYRDPTATQTTDLVENDPMPAESIEAALDYQTMLNQRTRDIAARCLQQPEGDGATIARLPAKVTRANTYLAFDADGDPIAGTDPTGYPASTFMATVLDDTSALAARVTLNAEKVAYVATVGGTVDAIALTPTEAVTAYAAGQRFSFIPSGANTTNVTVNVSGLGAVTLGKKAHGAVGFLELSPGDLGNATGLVEIAYNGSVFVLLTSPHGGEFGAAYTPTLGGTATYTSRQIRAWKHGRMAHVEVQMTVNAIGTGSTTQMSGLPVPLYGSIIAPVYWNTAASSIVTCVAVITGGVATFYSLTAAGATLSAANAIFQNGTTVYFTADYLTSD